MDRRRSRASGEPRRGFDVGRREVWAGKSKWTGGVEDEGGRRWKGEAQGERFLRDCEEGRRRPRGSTDGGLSLSSKFARERHRGWHEGAEPKGRKEIKQPCCRGRQGSAHGLEAWSARDSATTRD